MEGQESVGGCAHDKGPSGPVGIRDAAPAETPWYLCCPKCAPSVQGLASCCRQIGDIFGVQAAAMHRY